MGTLYIVATPIGNLEDITVRAIRILLTVPVVACEDTRRTGQLIKILEDKYKKYLTPSPSPSLGEGKRKLISVRDWNEAKMVPAVLEQLNMGDVALVSDAGTPLLSDPGFKLVRAARAAGFNVSPIPGPFAGAAALSASGMPTNKFKFWGFLPKKWELEAGLTHVIYEAPKRMNKTLIEIMNRYPDAEVVVAQEMTKIHEQIFNFQFSIFKQNLNTKGEITILVFRGEGGKEIAAAHVNRNGEMQER